MAQANPASIFLRSSRIVMESTDLPIFLQYASRLYQHFPALFFALGCPTLPVEFNLRPEEGAEVLLEKTDGCMIVGLRLPRVVSRLSESSQNSDCAGDAGEDLDDADAAGGHD